MDNVSKLGTFKYSVPDNEDQKVAVEHSISFDCASGDGLDTWSQVIAVSIPENHGKGNFTIHIFMEDHNVNT